MLEGKIAAIVDDNSVVINLGSEAGARPGMKFDAIFETQDIADPDDPKKILGGLVFKIAQLEASVVQERLTFCTIKDPYVGKGLNQLANFFPTESKIDPSATKLGGSINLKLRVGTVVRQTAEAAKSATMTTETTTPERRFSL